MLKLSRVMHKVLPGSLITSNLQESLVPFSSKASGGQIRGCKELLISLDCVGAAQDALLLLPRCKSGNPAVSYACSVVATPCSTVSVV